MQQIVPCRWSLVAFGVLLAGVATPPLLEAQTVSGQARVVKASVVGLTGTTTSVLSDTGALTDSSDARQASQVSGAVTSVLRGGTLHATTIGWPDEVASEASIADLALSLAGTRIGADFVMSRVRAVQGSAASGSTGVTGLTINGVPVGVTGAPNQTIAIPGGRVVINEQQTTASGTVVNALHVVVTGVADIVIASASAGIQ
jgi:hypothetical protein